MTDQLTLAYNDPVRGQTRRDDCDSSHAAADKVDATRQRDVLHRLLADAPAGLTADELAERTPWIREHVSSRLKQMERWGLCYSHGKRVNGNNNAVKVWFFTSPDGTVDSQVAEKYL